ncbi:MAG: hypothetical protein NZ602_05610 [Thermoguttaceae bacterium]|nr:hypothetical protein [Thermoguttaceae bacterium]MDW8036519.1 hypothetical protein [Thermoguttaceae bacterium]
MIVERYISDFWVWLLGPGWSQGLLFPWLLYLLGLLGVGGLIWAVLVGGGWLQGLRLTARQSHRLARIVAYSILGFSLLVIVLMVVRWTQPSKDATATQTPSVQSSSDSSQKSSAQQASSKSIPSEPASMESSGSWAGLGAVLLGPGWTEGVFYQWVGMVSVVLWGILVIGGLAGLIRYGPIGGLKAVDRTITEVTEDLLRLSPRRVWALARLAIQEALRRRIVIGFILFLLLLLFAGWYLDPGSVNPTKLYLQFVLTTTSYLMLPLMLFLSTFSLPTDIRSRTIHTVVTKPVRASEIVLGRILGFSLVGAGLLLLMSIISYIFVIRGLSHTHEITAEMAAEAIRQARTGIAKDIGVMTSRVHNHRHVIHWKPAERTATGQPDQLPEGTFWLSMEQGHTHRVIQHPDGKLEVGPPEGNLIARVPLYGKLRFLDRQGQPTDKGINVGEEWEYRSYIDGRTGAAAIWTFEGIHPERFPEGLLVEMTLGVFRSWKGEIEQGIRGSLSVRNPTTGRSEEVFLFTAKEFQIDSHWIPRQIKGKDLFEHFVDEQGRLEIVLRCLDAGQFFGVSQADLYLRAGDASFVANFLKGYLGIGFQVLLVIGLGVALSTFLSGPVAMVATGGTLLLGFFGDFMYRLAIGKTYGGGPVESLIRLVTQENVISELEPSPRTTAAKMLDQLASGPLWAMSKILPRFGEFDCSNFVADGFDFPTDMVLANAANALGFLLPVFVLGYSLLKTQELAQ